MRKVGRKKTASAEDVYREEEAKEGTSSFRKKGRVTNQSRAMESAILV